MQNTPNTRLEGLFHEAARRQPGPEREAYLDGACGADQDLRSRIEALLVAHEEASGFLEEPAVGGPREGPGSSIGPYKLLQEIGEGGMGVVYMAEQTRPVNRKVALKVIKLGMDTKQVIARFEAERQALALMDHPNIARVLDAGATETGRPFFVMELVRGIAIHEYCDTHKLSTRERLALFVDVCHAVQHAHQKGVIHRDLKPSNVLVTSHDGRPVPKIIDFGVAKATNQRLTERTLFTEFRQVIGTPEYMSPEQAEMSGLDVDTRSDIYSLGVLLYTLLTGTTPVDASELRTAGFEEMTRMIREEEAPAPSTRISKLGALAGEVAERRRSDVGSLSRHFRGELDWIVMKALEKDRTRRYETAAAFAADVLRHLENRPVEAGPVQPGYRLRKFVVRNRSVVLGVGALVLVVALGLVGTIFGLLRARSEAERSRRIGDSLEEVLAMSDPALGASPARREEVLGNVRATFGTQHATYAAVLDTLSRSLHDAGEFEAAAELSEEAIGVWSRVHGEDHVNVAGSLSTLGSLQRLLGEEQDAERSLRRALSIFERAEIADGSIGHLARMELADILSTRGENAEADRLMGEALAALRASESTSRLRIIETLELRFLVQLDGHSDSAKDTILEVYEESKAFYSEDSPMLAMAAMGVGNYHAKRGDDDVAEPFLREALERFERLGRMEGVYVLTINDALFQILRKRPDPASQEEADQLLGKTIEGARGIWGAEALATNLVYYAERRLSRGKYAEAVRAIRDAHAAMVEDGRSFLELSRLRAALTEVSLQVSSRAGLDVEAYEEAQIAVERALQDEPENVAMLAVLALSLHRLGQHEDALAALELVGGPLADAGTPLAREVAPVDHAVRALVALTDERHELARREFEIYDGALRRKNTSSLERRLQEEVQDRLESHPSNPTDG